MFLMSYGPSIIVASELGVKSCPNLGKVTEVRRPVQPMVDLLVRIQIVRLPLPFHAPLHARGTPDFLRCDCIEITVSSTCISVGLLLGAMLGDQREDWILARGRQRGHGSGCGRRGRKCRQRQ